MGQFFNKLGNAVGWLIGGAVVLVSIPLGIQSIESGAMMLLASAAIVPPVRRKILAIGGSVSVGRYAVAIALLMTASLYVAGSVSAEKARAERAEFARLEAEETARQAQIERERNTQKFVDEKELILAAAHGQLKAGDYKGLLKNTGIYTVANDSELMALRSQASSELKRIRVENRTAELLAELKTIPVAEYGQNLARYRELTRMHPDNSRYQKKVSFYSEKVEVLKRERIAREERKKNIEKQFSFDYAIHFPLRRHIKSKMHNPKSFKHVKTTHSVHENYIVVAMKYRGTNGFGAVVTNSVVAKYSVNGYLLEIAQL